jgi:hypothetical protein
MIIKKRNKDNILLVFGNKNLLESTETRNREVIIMEEYQTTNYHNQVNQSNIRENRKEEKIEKIEKTETQSTLSPLLRLPEYGLYIIIQNGNIYCSAITKHGLPEQSDDKIAYSFYLVNWLYTRRDKNLLEEINRYYNTNYDLRKLANKKWYQRLKERV